MGRIKIILILILKHLKEKAVEMRGNVAFLCCDDKANVSTGETNAPVSTGVRGKMTIAPVSTTLGALDHGMTKASLTPSVLLQCDIPESSAKSFVRGKVTMYSCEWRSVPIIKPISPCCHHS